MLAARVVAAVLGALAALDVLEGLAAVASEPLVGAAYILTGGTAALLGALVALDPRRLTRWFKLNPSSGAHVAAITIQAIVAYVVFGYGVIIQTLDGLQTVLDTGQHPATGGLSGELIVNAVIFNLILFLVAAIAWPILVTGNTVRTELGLAKPVLPAILAGAVVLLGYILVIAALALAAQELGFEAPGNPQADAIRNALTPALAIVVSAGAAIGEEAYFRGLLQSRMGLWRQAILFGLVHASYLTPLQVILPFLMGLVLGLARRRWGLLSSMTTHFLVNALALAVPME